MPKNFYKKYKILNPLIDLNYWKRKSIKISKINIPKITCVGNINKTKNYLNLLKYLNEIDIKFDLNIIGEVLKTQKKYFIKIKQIQNIINRKKFKKVEFLGRQKSSKVKSFLNHTNIFILPSISEGMSISLMEAMSMGCICLVSKNSNKSKIIINNKNGFIFNLSKNSFENSIKKIINLKNKKKKNIQNLARKTIVNLKNNNNIL